jgi:hypothetical protein
MEQNLSSGDPNRSSLSSTSTFPARRLGGWVLPLIVAGCFCAKASANEKGSGTVSVPFKQASDDTTRTNCILNQRNVQQAVRADQHMRGLKNGAPITWQNLIGKRGFLEAKPVCPGGGEYQFAERLPAKGKLALKCSKEGHEPDSHADW